MSALSAGHKRRDVANAVAVVKSGLIAPVLSVPFRHLAGSWQGSLSSWALPGLVGGVLWVPVMRWANEREPRRTSLGAWLLAPVVILVGLAGVELALATRLDPAHRAAVA